MGSDAMILVLRIQWKGLIIYQNQWKEKIIELENGTLYKKKKTDCIKKREKGNSLEI